MGRAQLVDHPEEALQVAGYTEHRVKRLLADAGIVRNRAKILADCFRWRQLGRVTKGTR